MSALVIGASDIVDEAACLIWSELCPDMVMGDEDRPHYEAAAKAVLALRAPAQRLPMLADVAQIIANGWLRGNSPFETAAEILQELDTPAVTSTECGEVK